MFTTKLQWLAAPMVVTLTAGPAAAFYFPGYPGDGLPPRPTVMAPGVARLALPPDGIRADDPLDPPTFLDSLGPPPLLDPPPDVPEPATLALAVAGVGVVAVRRGVRRSRARQEAAGCRARLQSR